MKVIVAGYPKTGTTSMSAALTELGYNVYDTLENSIWLEKEYDKIINEGWTTEDFRKMYHNVDAVTDFPACFFWDEIHKAFPDAKIILTIREDEDVWCKSLRAQLESQQRPSIRFLPLFSPTWRRVGNNIAKKAFPIILGIKYPSMWSSQVEMNEQMAKKCYRSHNADVMQNAPKDNLLIFKCSEGWQPLCEFLDLPVPSTPFPHRNMKGSAINGVYDNPIMTEINNEVLKSVAIYAITAGLVTYCSFNFGPAVMAREGCNYWTAIVEKLSSCFKAVN